MSACEKCGVELFGQPAINGPLTAYEGPLFGAPLHTPERCRDRLAARLAEAGEQVAAVQRSANVALEENRALRAELETTKARIAALKAGAK